MNRKSVISGAMIVAAGVAAPDGQGNAATGPAAAIPLADGEGLGTLHLDDDLLFAGDGDVHDELFSAGSEDALAELHYTVYGGIGDDRLMDGKVVTVTDPATGKPRRYFVSSETGGVYDPQTGKRVDPPAWAKRQIQAK